MNNINTLVFGCSGLIGIELIKSIKKNESLFLSRKKPRNLSSKYWKKINLNSKIKGLPNRVEKIFFLASPYYIKNNIKKKNFKKEFIWINKICKKIKAKTFIYLSSSSVYLKKHPIGEVKIKCEIFLKKSKIKNLQIWRPFNIIGFFENKISDHFHNLLIKKFIINKKSAYTFSGNEFDIRGYSSVKKFCKKVISNSKTNKSFMLNYGNSNTITSSQMFEIFKKIYKKKYNKNIDIAFKSKKKNINTINTSKKTKTINSNEDSKKVLINYFKKMIL
jgi:nucleoside-diphosphate-sugar epimerase|tara:strand:- start:1395 stop:2222 length:828 start_codon:yes stop_codon:yes gene_type:complete